MNEYPYDTVPSKGYPHNPNPSSLLQEELYPAEDEKDEKPQLLQKSENKRKQSKTEQDFAKNWRVFLSVKLKNLVSNNIENFCLRDYPGISENLYDSEHPSLKNIKEIFAEKLGKKAQKVVNTKLKTTKFLLILLDLQKHNTMILINSFIL